MELNPELATKLMLGAAAVVCLWLIVKGMVEMLRINAGAEDVIQTQGVVRQLRVRRGGGYHAVLTLNVGAEVCHVDCVLPGPRHGRKRRRVTDLVLVLWRRGETRAVAAATIYGGQRMFLIGIVGLALIGAAYAILF